MAYDMRPIVLEETQGTKHYCTCGESSNKPYCDGAHSQLNTGKLPKEIRFAETKRVSICDCGHTGNSPYCYGAHSKL